MADDLSVLFRIRGDASGAKQSIAQAREAVASLRQTSSTDLARLGQSGSRSLQQLESAIASVKERIKEVKAEAKGDIGFKAERLEGLRERLKGLTAEQRALQKSTKEAAQAYDSDLSGALQAISPRLAGLVGAAGPITLAAAGLVAVAAGAAAAAVGLFKVTQEAAAFTGKFLDLSQQVGVSVETLSTLDNIAATTGGNIETVAASLAIFQRNLESAHDPTSKEAKLLKELGVTSLDTETALRQTIKGLFELTDTTKQTDSVLTLFGRSGRFVNAILKESNGDIDKATEKFSKMGLVLSTEAATAADQFNDALEIIDRQLGVVTRTLTADAIPVFTVFFEDLSVFLTKNGQDWDYWSRVIEAAVASALAALQTLIIFIASKGQIDPLVIFDNLTQDLIRRAEELKTAIRVISVVERATRAALGGGGRPGDRPDPSKAKDEAEARAAKEISLSQKALEESTREHRQRLERERDLDLKSIDEWETESIKAAEDHLKEQNTIFDQEEANLRKFVKNESDLFLALADVQLRRTKATNELTATLLKTSDEAQRRRDQAELRVEQQLFKIRQAEREGELNRIKDALDRQATIESEALTKRLAIERQAHEEEKILREIELNAISTSAARKQEIENEAIESEQKFTDRVKELIEERIRAREREANRPGAGGIPEQTPDELARLAGQAADREAGPPPSLKLHFDAVKLLSGAYEDLFANIGRGVGEVVQNLVLFGNAGPQAFRKVAASALASVAATAAAQAIYELALGFAALTPWGAALYGPAPLHFKAAALLGSIAVVAGVAGRAVAGNAFSGGGGAAGGGGLGSPGPLQTIVTGRNQQQRPLVVHLDIKTDGGQIVKTWADDFNNGGITREVIAGDGR